MSDFADAFAIGASALDALYGEPVQLVPQLNDETAAVVVRGVDPNRPAQNLVGIYDDVAVISRVVGSGANTHDNIDVLASKAQVDLDAAQFPTTVSLPLQGDILVLTARAGAPRLSIVSVQPDNVSRIVCLVEPAGAAS